MRSFPLAYPTGVPAGRHPVRKGALVAVALKPETIAQVSKRGRSDKPEISLPNPVFGDPKSRRVWRPLSGLDARHRGKQLNLCSEPPIAAALEPTAGCRAPPSRTLRGRRLDAVLASKQMETPEEFFQRVINRRAPQPNTPQRRRCSGIKRNGERCNAWAVTGKDQCAGHLKLVPLDSAVGVAGGEKPPKNDGSHG